MKKPHLLSQEDYILVTDIRKQTKLKEERNELEEIKIVLFKCNGNITKCKISVAA